MSTEAGVRPVHADDLVAVVPAVPARVRDARERLRSWLDQRDWPRPEADDMVLAVNEAVTNVVEHAYPPSKMGMCHLHAWVSTTPQTGERRLVATVTDRGRWPAAVERSTAAADRFRGRGLELMRGLVAQMYVQRSAGGTTIILIGSVDPATTASTD